MGSWGWRTDVGRRPGVAEPHCRQGSRNMRQFRPPLVKTTVALLAVLATSFGGPVLASPPVRLADGIEVAQGGGWLRLTVCDDDIIRVAYSRDRGFFDRPSLVIERREVAP